MSVSALERLRELPPLFRGADLTLRFQWTSKTASQYLYLWRRRGLVQALGGHSDTFANLLVQPRPDWEQAVRLAMPSATLVGIEALRRSGWTTQIQQRPTIAVLDTGPVFTVEPYLVSPRSPRWFTASRSGIRDGCLTSAYALADLLHREGWGACGLQPDDIDWDLFTPVQARRFRRACTAYGVDPERLGVPLGSS